MCGLSILHPLILFNKIGKVSKLNRKFAEKHDCDFYIFDISLQASLQRIVCLVS